MNSINDILNSKADDLFPDDKNILEINDEPVDQTNTIDIITEDTNPTIEPIINEDIDITKLKTMIHQMKDQLDAMLRIVEGKQITDFKKTNPDSEILQTGERIIEGVFNGEQMIGADGKEYTVPPNYASKSKLVEGDMMKLTITNNGSFIFKQIGPIDRKSLIGEIVSNGEQYSVLANGRTYKVLTASVTFYRGKTGDEAVILVPQNGESAWAAVDNIINK